MPKRRKNPTKTSMAGNAAGWVLVPKAAFNELTQCYNNLTRHSQNIGATAGFTGAGTRGRRGRPAANASIT